MSKELVVCVLNELDAEDFSSEMQVATPEGGRREDLKEWMWRLDDYKVELGTYFEDGKLVGMEFWDATWMEPIYHHAQQYCYINRITFDRIAPTYDVDVIEVVVPGISE